MNTPDSPHSPHTSETVITLPAFQEQDGIDLFSKTFKPNPVKHGLTTFKNGAKYCTTVNSPATSLHIAQQLKGEITLGYLPGHEAGEDVLMIDLDKKSYGTVSELDSARDKVVLAFQAVKLPVYLERSSGGGWHVWCFLDKVVPYDVCKRAGKEVLRRAGISLNTEVFPKGNVESNWMILPYSGAMQSDGLGRTFLTTVEGEPIGFYELDKIQRCSAEMVSSLALATPQERKQTERSTTTRLHSEALEMLKEAALNAPETFKRHESIPAFLTLAEQCGKRDEMIAFLQSPELYTAWLPNGDRSLVAWQGEVERWSNSEGDKKRGIPFLKEQGFIIPDLPVEKIQKSKLHFYSLDDLDKMPDVSWHIKDVIPSDSLVVIYGEPATGKTFLALDLARTTL